MAGGEKVECSNCITEELYQPNENRRRQVSIVKRAGQVLLIEVREGRMAPGDLGRGLECCLLLLFIPVAGRRVRVEQLGRSAHSGRWKGTKPVS